MQPKKLHSKVEDLEMKLDVNELSLNRLNQYDRSNNIEVQGISSNIADEALEDKVVNVFEFLNINIKKSDIEGCHGLGKANPKNTNVRFVNKKHAEKALKRKSDLKNIDNVNLNLNQMLSYSSAKTWPLSISTLHGNVLN